MAVAAIGVAAMSADARSQLRKYRNQPYGSEEEPQWDREDDEEHDPYAQLMLAAWSIEGYSCEHRKGRGDDSPHAAGDRKHDKDVAK